MKDGSEALQTELRRFGDEVASASRQYFSYAGSNLAPFVFGLDILITTAVVWLRHATEWEKKEIEQAIVDRVHVVCDIAFGPPQTSRPN